MQRLVDSGGVDVVRQPLDYTLQLAHIVGQL
jgi:hypothetical protein